MATLQEVEDLTEEVRPLKRYRNDLSEKKLQNQIEMLQAAFPNKFIDPLMASVLLKTPPERLAELLKQPELWETPDSEQEQVLMGCVTIE